MRHRGSVEAPSVFLDRSGRRRRLMRVVGACVGAGLATVLVLLAAAVLGVGPSHIPGFPDVAGNPQVTATPAEAPGAEQTGSAQSGNGSGGSTTPTNATTAGPTATKPGHVPTQTPPHPTKTR